MLGKDFLLSALRHWHMLPRAAMEVPFLEAFKGRLDEILGNLILCLVTLSIAGGLELDGL